MSVSSLASMKNYPTGGTGTVNNQSPGRSSIFQMSEQESRLRTKVESKNTESNITQQVKQLYGAYASRPNPTESNLTESKQS
jgi:hypothetical protein